MSVCCVFLRSLLNIFRSLQCAIWNRKWTSNGVLEVKNKMQIQDTCRMHNNEMEMTNDIQMCTMWILFQYKIQKAYVWLNISKVNSCNIQVKVCWIRSNKCRLSIHRFHVINVTNTRKIWTNSCYTLTYYRFLCITSLFDYFKFDNMAMVQFRESKKL